MFTLAKRLIPVITSQQQIVEMAGPARVKRLLGASNARAVYTRRRCIGAIELFNYGDDSRSKPRAGNPQEFSFRSETEENPKNVWALKRLELV